METNIGQVGIKYVAVAVVVDEEGRLLVRQRGSSEAEAGSWELPGGFIEPQELPDTAACRELLEETGIHGTDPILLGAIEWPDSHHGYLILLFYAVVPRGSTLSPTGSGAFVPLEKAAQLQLLPPDRCVVNMLLNCQGSLQNLVPQDWSEPHSPSDWDLVWASADNYIKPERRQARTSSKLAWFQDLGHDYAKDERVLDVGCGPGHALDLLRRYNPNVYYVGVDQSSVAIADAIRPHRGRRANFLFWQKERLPFPSSIFSTVLAFGLLEHQVDPRPLLVELRRVLVDTGELLVIQSSTRTWFYPARLLRQMAGRWPYGFQRNISPAQAEAVLRDAGFTIVGKSLKHAQLAGDYILPYLDRLTGIFTSRWRRYIVLRSIA